MPASKDPVVEANRQMLLERSDVGISKYGVTLANSGLNLEQFIQHALEETLDLANYLQAAKHEVDELLDAIEHACASMPLHWAVRKHLFKILVKYGRCGE